ncbi:LysR family transcriptional regulator [Alteromonas gilva]|uniref:LysR family transcriptional regulator n=1 Tax=Alteromonas gilva TaxID=2987522 RepID=A0ABT5KZA4_9ALTE|nr:LysR family transcriptional regulator [Alteromonas gilva]MDC8829536.1 LysR family transcriptional regulator [Alteromonas gilva]
MANWEGINEFVAVAETQSFTQAAKRLALSTAQVSRQIARLENRLSTKLLNRTTRVVALTDSGDTFYRHCKPILEELSAAEKVVTDLQAKPTGKLKMTAPVTYGERIIAPIINDISAAYPELQIQLHLTNQVVDLIHDGYDLAIRLGELEDSSYIARRLSSRAWHLAASPTYLDKHGTPHSLSELPQHQCILGTSDNWKFRRHGKSEIVKVRARLRCNSGVALIDAALKHLGIVQLPDYYIAPYLASGELIELLPQQQIADEGIWALYPPTRHLSPKVRMVIDRLVSAM